MIHTDPTVTLADAGNVQINIAGVPSDAGGEFPADRQRQLSA